MCGLIFIFNVYCLFLMLVWVNMGSYLAMSVRLVWKFNRLFSSQSQNIKKADLNQLLSWFKQIMNIWSTAKWCSHSIARDHLEISSKFEENLTAVLIGVDSNTIHCKNWRGLFVDSELIANVANDCSEGCLFWDGDHFEGLVDFGGQNYLEGHFVGTH